MATIDVTHGWLQSTLSGSCDTDDDATRLGSGQPSMNLNTMNLKFSTARPLCEERGLTRPGSKQRIILD